MVAQSSAQEYETRAGPARARRVLIADDNRDLVLTLMVLLEDEGYEVQGVHSGTEVMPAMRSFNPDTVVLDIKMPGLNGFEVAKMIRKRYGEVRPLLIALSGHYKLGSDKVLTQIVGFNHHLAKPYDPQALLALLRI